MCQQLSPYDLHVPEDLCKQICEVIDSRVSPTFRDVMEYFIMKKLGSYVDLGSALISNPAMVYTTLIDILGFKDTANVILKLLIRRLAEGSRLSLNVDDVVKGVVSNNRKVVYSFVKQVAFSRS